jgi:UDP-glucose 4-epimerase
VKFLELNNFEVFPFTSNQPLIKGGQINEYLRTVQNIVWCASRVNPITAVTRPDLAEVELTEWRTFLAAWEMQSSPEQRLIFLSSGGCTYSSDVLPFCETDEANGMNQYGKLKISMEQALLLKKASCVVLRVANVYGPGQLHGKGQGVIAEWVNSIKKGEDIRVFGSVESFRDYIFIEDLCEAILRTLFLDDKKQIFNVGSGVSTDLKTILDICTSLKSKKTKILLEQGRPTDRNGYFLDITKFQSLTNWEPVFSIETGLQKTIQHYND